MNIIHCKGYEEMSDLAATFVSQEVATKKDLLLCAATGHSPQGLYSRLVDQASRTQGFFDQLRVIQLDEWGGLPKNHPATCASYLQQWLLEPLAISPQRTISFQSAPADPAQECARMQSVLAKNGPIDLCILGLGGNGHIGFNEPAPFLEPHCHVAHLSETTLHHAMVQALNNKPAYGLTLGLSDILHAKRILLLITGSNKEKVTEAFLSGKITTQLPASLLWLHPHVDCLIG
ncbi:MAG: galactosamine-6-phosphate isomerase [Bacteroidota bacterium]